MFIASLNPMLIDCEIGSIVLEKGKQYFKCTTTLGALKIKIFVYLSFICSPSLRRLPNGHINITAFDRMAAIVGAFTKHMQSMKTTQAPSGEEYAQFCHHMQQTTKLGESGELKE